MLDIHTHHLFSADTESDMFVTSMIFNIIAVGFFFVCLVVLCVLLLQMKVQTVPIILQFFINCP